LGGNLFVAAVDSVLVRLDLLPRPAVTVARPDLLFALVRAGFWQRRKMLRNALTASPVLRPLAGGLAAAFAAARVAGNRRAETLSLEEFAALAEALSAAAPALPPRIPDEEDDAEDPGGG
jgi:16S rRNA (adenine1518-N6/adenine1519-N6)-dimethyltransferase